MEHKRNCWEVLKCGLESDGAKVGADGPCPAAIESRANGMHGGINGGRICWSVLHTRCFGGIQNNYASKMKTCLECEFYKRVKAEEGIELLSPSDVLKRLATGP